MQNTERIVGLMRKFLSEQISVEERQELNDWVAENDFNRQVFRELTEENSLREELAPFAEADWNSIWNKIANQTKVVAIQPKQKTIWKYLAAASILILFLVSGYYWLNSAKQKDIAKITTTINKNDVPPETEKAVLNLADGTKVTLNNSVSGTIAQQGNTVIIKENE